MQKRGKCKDLPNTYTQKAAITNTCPLSTFPHQLSEQYHTRILEHAACTDTVTHVTCCHVFCMPDICNEEYV